jgi:hypothetical protein
MARNTAAKDSNFVNTKIAILNSDGITIAALTANPTTGALKINDGTTGTSYAPLDAKRDPDFAKCLLAVSYIDNKTLVPLQADSTGALLVDSA